MITTQPLGDMPKSCMTCVHFVATKKILWIIPIGLRHPRCSAVREYNGDMAFTQLERAGYNEGHPHHCGPEGKFHANAYVHNWPDGVPEL